jgi:hypothetical protein
MTWPFAGRSKARASNLWMGMAVDPGFAYANGKRKKPDGKAIRFVRGNRRLPIS